MKTKLISGLLVVILMMTFSFSPINAQEEEKTSPFSVGADLVSSYVWRGSKQGNGPNIQPSFKYTTGGLTLGSWGSYSFHQGAGNDLAETDLYASYAFDFGLSLGLSDYFYQGSPWFTFSDSTSSHAVEINLAYAIKSFSFAANYIVNDASQGGPANKPGGGDMYFEANYTFENFGVFLGAGNGWHTTDKANGDDIFTVCNIGLKTSKEIKITDNFSLPLSGALSINPDKEELNLVVGISF